MTLTPDQIACLRLFAHAIGHDDRVSVESRITARALHMALSEAEQSGEDE